MLILGIPPSPGRWSAGSETLMWISALALITSAHIPTPHTHTHTHTLTPHIHTDWETGLATTPVMLAKTLHCRQWHYLPVRTMCPLHRFSPEVHLQNCTHQLNPPTHTHIPSSPYWMLRSNRLSSVSSIILILQACFFPASKQLSDSFSYSPCLPFWLSAVSYCALFSTT